MNTYIYVETTDIELLHNILPDYLLSQDNVLMKNGEYVKWRENSEVRQILSNNNIHYNSVIKCPNCEEWTSCYYEIHSRNGNFYVCEECVDAGDYFYCEDCDEYYDYTYNTYETYNGDSVCENCRYDHYVECSDCNELYHENDIIYCEDCDAYYCNGCWEEHYHEDQLLYDYHDFNDWREHHLENETPDFYIGHELEIDEGSDMEEAVDTISQIDGICMHDGSLSCRGIEFISHPFSYNYMLSMEQDYRNTFDHLIHLGYKSHNTNTCGLHFHVTRPTDSKIIDRIILFMETYKEEIITLSRRHSDELNRWSRFLSDKKQGTNPKVIKSLDYIVNNKVTSDRYMALNLTNSRTIEFRFFKGTLNYDTFMADFEFIYNLVHFASDLSIPVEELTWTKITSEGKFLPHYIEEHNLHSDKPLIDYSQELLVEFNERKAQARIEVDNIIRDILKLISNKARQKNNTAEKLRVTQGYINKWNDTLNQARIVLYNLENLDIFNYDSLNIIKSDIKYIKERLGK